MTQTPEEFDCPQCGEPTSTFHEGYCEDCCAGNQQALDLHNSRFDWWAKLSDPERSEQIRKAI